MKECKHFIFLFLFFFAASWAQGQTIPIVIRENNPALVDKELQKTAIELSEKKLAESRTRQTKVTKAKRKTKPAAEAKNSVPQTPPLDNMRKKSPIPISSAPTISVPAEENNTQTNVPPAPVKNNTQTIPAMPESNMQIPAATAESNMPTIPAPGQENNMPSADDTANQNIDSQPIEGIPLPLPQEETNQEVAQAEKNNLPERAASESYWQTALMQENSGQLENAKQSYRRVLEFQDRYYLQALARLAYLGGKSGEPDAIKDAELLGDKEKAAVYYYQASGFETRFLEHPAEKQWLPRAIETYNEVLRLNSTSVWAERANLRMARLYFNLKNYENSLFCLLNFMRSPKEDENSAQRYSDLSWFLLARILEVSEKNFDPHRAILAYRKVLQFPDSLYKEQARMYLQNLEKKYPTNN